MSNSDILFQVVVLDLMAAMMASLVGCIPEYILRIRMKWPMYGFFLACSMKVA